MDERGVFVFKGKVREQTNKKYIKKGVCSKCGFVGYTEWHHLVYHVDCVVELCSQCHRNDKSSIKKKKINELLRNLV